MSNLTMRIKGAQNLNLDVRRSSGTSDYNGLINKPSIEGVQLVGDRTFSQLGIREMTLGEIDDIVFGRS